MFYDYDWAQLWSQKLWLYKNDPNHEITRTAFESLYRISSLTFKDILISFISFDQNCAKKQTKGLW